MAKKILVTGGAGFIGSHLVDLLVEQGHDVRVMDCLDKGTHPRNTIPSYINPRAEWRLGNCRVKHEMDTCIKDIEVVFHLASKVGVGLSMYKPHEFMENNVGATTSLMQSILDDKHSKVERIVLASSMSVYGEGSYKCSDPDCITYQGMQLVERYRADLEANKWEPSCACGADLISMPTDERWPVNPTSFYAQSKLNQENVLGMFAVTYGVPVLALRLFNTFGPRQALSNPYSGVLSIFANRLMNQQPPIIFEDGQQLRSFTHVKDVVRAFSLAMNACLHGKLYGFVNVGHGNSTLTEMAGLLSAIITGAEVNPAITQSFRKGDIRHCWTDGFRAYQHLGWKREINMLPALKDYVSWLNLQPLPEDKLDEAMVELNDNHLMIEPKTEKVV